MIPPAPHSTLLPYTTLFRSSHGELSLRSAKVGVSLSLRGAKLANPYTRLALNAPQLTVERTLYLTPAAVGRDRKSTRLNSSHMSSSYAVFCLKKKKPEHTYT